MITKEALKKQVARSANCGEDELNGIPVKEALKDIDCCGVVVCYGNIPDDVLNDTF